MNEPYLRACRTLSRRRPTCPEGPRAAFLDAACAGEPELRAEVEGLLELRRRLREARRAMKAS